MLSKKGRQERPAERGEEGREARMTSQDAPEANRHQRARQMISDFSSVVPAEVCCPVGRRTMAGGTNPNGRRARPHLETRAASVPTGATTVDACLRPSLRVDEE